MDRVPGFQELLQGLSPALTAPSVASLCTLVSGWLFSGRGIVTRMIVAAGSGATKHFSSYHGLLSAASWSLDAMGLAALTMIRPFLGDVVMLGLDDTLARKRGLRMFLRAALSAVRQSADRGDARRPGAHAAGTGCRDASHPVRCP